MRKSILGKCISTLAALGLSALLVRLAKGSPEFITTRYTPLSRLVLGKLGGVFDFCDFSVAEIALYALILAFIVSIPCCLARLIKRDGFWGFLHYLTGLTATLSGALLLFMLLWGLNYYGQPLSEQLNLSVEPTDTETLCSAAEYYLDKAAEYAPLVERSSDGSYVHSEFSQLAELSLTGYYALSDQYELFDAEYSPPKRVLFSTGMSDLLLSGVFTPYTAECNVNPDISSACLPFTMAHELAHRVGVAPENEANFAAFLSCISSDDPQMLYSGYYMAFIYCYNAVAAVDSQRQAELWSSAPDSVIADVKAMNEHYNSHKGKVSDTAETVNDRYLRAMSQDSGVKSYGEVADLLIAYYLRETA